MRFLPILEQWLQDDESVWKIHHHTATRMYEHLVKEYGPIPASASVTCVDWVCVKEFSNA